MSAIGKPQRGREAGFTLIELLVALAITGLLSGIAFPALQHQLERSAQIEAQTTLGLVLAQARADAIATDAPVRVMLSGDRGVLQTTSGRLPKRLPPKVALEWPNEGFVFYPDGTANGGFGALGAQSMLSTQGTRGTQFSVDAATSRIVFAQ